MTPNLSLADENLRGYTLLLSAHFQGFCRDLYAECTQFVVAEMPLQSQPMVQTQFTTSLTLDRINANDETLKDDFKRIDLNFDLTSIPSGSLLLNPLDELNRWRNIVAHQGMVPPSGFPQLPNVKSWRGSRDAVATTLDAMM